MSHSAGSRRRASRAVLMGLVLALLAAGCGSRWDHAQRTEMRDRYASERSSGRSAGTTGTTLAAGSEGTTDGGTAAGTGGGTATGTGGSTTGDGTGGGGAPSGSLPCAAASTAPGVTKDTITIGTVGSLSGPIPGLGASSLGGVRAYAAYLNSIGGVCGRQVKVKSADDGGDNAQDRAVTADLEPQVLGLVGGVAGAIQGSEDVIAQTKIPAVETAVSPAFIARVPNVFGTNPGYPDLKAVTGKFKYLHDHGATKAAIVYINAQSAPEEIRIRQKPLMQAAGIQVVLELPLPLTTLSYDSAARAVANSGADYLFFLHEAGAAASMARSMADTGYHLKFAEYLTAYASPFLDLAGSAGEGAISWIRMLPNEDKGSNKMLDTYLSWMGRAASDVPADGFAADSWAASKAFFDALTALKGPITREGIVAQLKTVDMYDADGFYGPIRLGPKLTNGCLIAMIAKGGKWQRLTPAQGFVC